MEPEPATAGQVPEGLPPPEEAESPILDVESEPQQEDDEAQPEPPPIEEAEQWGVLHLVPGSSGALAAADGDAAHAPFELRAPVLTIGRSEGADLTVQDARVSNIHAQLTRVGCEAFIENLSSSATYVDGASIGHRSLHQLRGGETISLVMVVEPEPFNLSFTFESQLRSPTMELRRVFDEEFSCGVCYELLWRPLTLVPCGHSFCASCISGWQRSRAPAKLSCPFCKDTVEVNMVFINHSFRNLVSAYLCTQPTQASPPESLAAKERETTLTDAMMPLMVHVPDHMKLQVVEAVQAVLNAANTSGTEGNADAAEVAGMSQEATHQVLHDLLDLIRQDSNAEYRRFCIAAITGITTLMRRWLATDAELLHTALMTVAFICKNSRDKRYRPELAEAAISADLFRTIVAAVEAQGENHARLCAEANATCGNLISKGRMGWNTAAIGNLIEAGGVPMICTTCMTHPDQFRIQHNSALALEHLLQALDEEEELRGEHRERVVEELGTTGLVGHFHEMLRRWPVSQARGRTSSSTPTAVRVERIERVMRQVCDATGEPLPAASADDSEVARDGA